MDPVRDPMEAKNHWGLTGVQLAFSIFVLVETWLVPLEGWLVDRFGPRPVIAAGGILAALGWVINSMATSLPELYVAAVVSGIGAGCVYGTCVGNALKWFPDKRGLAAGLTAAGFGAGAALTVIPIANMIQSSGYEQTFLVFGLLQGAVILIIAMFMVRPTPPTGVVVPPRIVMRRSTTRRRRCEDAGVLADLCAVRRRRRRRPDGHGADRPDRQGLRPGQDADQPARPHAAASDDDAGDRQSLQRLHAAAVRIHLRSDRPRKHHADRVRRRRPGPARPEGVRPQPVSPS